MYSVDLSLVHLFWLYCGEAMIAWKSLIWAGCLVPVLAGCSTFQRATPQATNDEVLRREARAKWRQVRDQYPNHNLTNEFRDGFVNGYIDNGNTEPSQFVPPVQYARDKKYFTPKGQALIRDYFLGIKYGMDVAVTSGRRSNYTAPVQLPNDKRVAAVEPVGPAKPAAPQGFLASESKPDVPKAMSTEDAITLPPLPMSASAMTPPTRPPLPGIDDVLPLPVPPGTSALPPPPEPLMPSPVLTLPPPLLNDLPPLPMSLTSGEVEPAGRHCLSVRTETGGTAQEMKSVKRLVRFQSRPAQAGSTHGLAPRVLRKALR